MRPGSATDKTAQPYEFLVATGRLLARIPKIPPAISVVLNVLASRCGRRGANGFPDTNAAWAAREG